jgi:hypothetical protein
MRGLAILLWAWLFTPALAQPVLKPPLAPLGFLVGNWKSDDGKVAETGGTSRGGSLVSVQSDGWALLRQDHTELFDKDGKPAGGFHQTMVIYSEAGQVHADYVDGEGHAIHYVSADITPGQSVTFSSSPGQGPVFRLRYDLKAPNLLTVNFGMIASGQSAFQPIASGTMRKMK